MEEQINEIIKGMVALESLDGTRFYTVAVVRKALRKVLCDNIKNNLIKKEIT